MRRADKIWTVLTASLGYGLIVGQLVRGHVLHLSAEVLIVTGTEGAAFASGAGRACTTAAKTNGTV